MACSKCNGDKDIVNKHFKLCLQCNNIRLHGNPYGKKYDNTLNKRSTNRRSNNNTRKNRKSLFSPVKNIPTKPSRKDKVLLDDLFYEECFNISDHKCEECGDQLPTEFRDDEGRVMARWRYSHIVPKSIAPKLRHNVININHLCLKDHREWENGNKESMKIYETNKARLPNYF